LLGKYEVFFRGGKREIVCNYVNDKREGDYKRWDYEGKVIEECIMKNDKVDKKCSIM